MSQLQRGGLLLFIMGWYCIQRPDIGWLLIPGAIFILVGTILFLV